MDVFLLGMLGGFVLSILFANALDRHRCDALVLPVAAVVIASGVVFVVPLLLARAWVRERFMAASPTRP